jgi:hypothetical protein
MRIGDKMSREIVRTRENSDRNITSTGAASRTATTAQASPGFSERLNGFRQALRKDNVVGENSSKLATWSNGFGNRIDSWNNGFGNRIDQVARRSSGSIDDWNNGFGNRIDR